MKAFNKFLSKLNGLNIKFGDYAILNNQSKSEDIAELCILLTIVILAILTTFLTILLIPIL